MGLKVGEMAILNREDNEQVLKERVTNLCNMNWQIGYANTSTNGCELNMMTAT